MKIEYKKYLSSLVVLVIAFVLVQGYFSLLKPGRGAVLAATTTSSKEVHNSTLDQVKTQVSLLIQENVDLKNKLQKISRESYVHRVLKRGMSGTDVLELQKTFASAGIGEGIAPSGYFGKTTEKLIRLFQEQKKLPVTGVVDDSTFEYLVSSGNDQVLFDSSQYSDLNKQLLDMSSLCIADPLLDLSTGVSQNTSTPISASSSDLSIVTPQDSCAPPSGVCPAGCLPQDQIPECPAPPTCSNAPAPLTSTRAPSVSTAPKPAVILPPKTPVPVIVPKTPPVVVPKAPVVVVPKVVSPPVVTAPVVVPKSVPTTQTSGSQPR